MQEMDLEADLVETSDEEESPQLIVEQMAYSMMYHISTRDQGLIREWTHFLCQQRHDQL